MKVNPNAGFFPDMQRLEMLRSINVTPQQKENIYVESRGVPIRLAIAAQILAAQASNGWQPFAADNRQGGSPDFRADRALEWADALIAAYNKGAA